MLADLASAYCWNFDVYVGKAATKIDRVFGLGSKVAIDLFKDLQDNGCIKFTFVSLFVMIIISWTIYPRIPQKLEHYE